MSSPIRGCPGIGATPLTEGLRETLDERAWYLSNADLHWERTSGRLLAIQERYRQRKIPLLLARSRFEIAVEQMADHVGYWEMPSWNDIANNRFHGFDEWQDFLWWTIYVANQSEWNTVRELSGLDEDVEPFDLANRAKPHCTLLVLDLYGWELLLVLKSSESGFGVLHQDAETGVGLLDIVRTDTEGEALCFTIPEVLLSEAHLRDTEL